MSVMASYQDTGISTVCSTSCSRVIPFISFLVKCFIHTAGFLCGMCAYQDKHMSCKENPQCVCTKKGPKPLRWRHNGRDSDSNHQPHSCLLHRLFRRRSRKTSKLRALALVWGIHRGSVNSPHKWPVTRKMFPFDDVIMISIYEFMML